MRDKEASHALVMYSADELYGTPGMIPPLVARTILWRKPGIAEKILPSASSHAPK